MPLALTFFLVKKEQDLSLHSYNGGSVSPDELISLRKCPCVAFGCLT
jgi:hypothetical protein